MTLEISTLKLDKDDVSRSYVRTQTPFIVYAATLKKKKKKTLFKNSASGSLYLCLPVESLSFSHVLISGEDKGSEYQFANMETRPQWFYQ